MQVNKSYGSILVALLTTIAPGFGNAVPANAQNSPAGAQGQRWSGTPASITVNGGYVYILRHGRVYKLRSAGLTLVSRGDSAPNSGPQGGIPAGVAGRSSANGGYNISVEGGYNGSGVTANSQSTPRAMRTKVPESLTVGGAINENGRSTPNGLTANGKHNSVQTTGASTGNAGMMAASMNDNVKATASGDYVYVLNGSTLYKMRATNMALVSRRNLSTIETDAIVSSSSANSAHAISRHPAIQ